MNNTEKNSAPVLYLAPLQGFTDFIYRKIYSTVFSGIDVFFIPYITVKNQEILRKYQREITPENNKQERVIPQVLVSDPVEMIFLARFIESLGYEEINLNLGCPYPMVTKQGMGAGLLPHPLKVEKVIAALFANSNLRLSVKMRAGMESYSEMGNVLEVLNRFPLSEVILHPRIAKQMYSGHIDQYSISFALENLNHRLVLNGDIHSVLSFNTIKSKFPEIIHFMLGRGVLMNPFLPDLIKNPDLSDNDKWQKIKLFHELIFEEYLATMDNPGNALNKMKQFWIYFSFLFSEDKKCLKRVEKSKTVNDYRQTVSLIFRGVIN